MTNKVNFKLVNTALVTLILYLLYKTSGLWVGIINSIINILKPFIFSFIIAYSLYPFLNMLIKKGIPKIIGILIIFIIISLIIILISYFTFKYSFNELYILFNNIISFISKFKLFDINILEKYFSSTLNNFGNIVNTSINFITHLFIIVGSCIYFLIDMDKIRNNIKTSIKNNKTYNYIKTIDIEMKKYLNGLIQIMFITFVEYMLFYTIIGHPNTILIAILASISNLIPCFGGAIVNIFALLIAISISRELALKTLILIIILGLIDSYIINPTIYGKTNSIHPLIIILFSFIFGMLLGGFGIFISFPMTILFQVTYKFYIKQSIDF